MTTLRIKICGLTRVADALMACEAGADAIGLVFYPPSSRYIEPARAAEIVRALPPFVQSVGLFVNPQPADVERTLAQVELDLLQFHGNEPAAMCSTFARPYIKAVAMRDGLDVNAIMAQHTQARGFLLDAYHPDKPGGTGEVFDWQRFPQRADKPLILAGGLTEANVAEAVRQCRPYAVDVSGGVESAPGKKSADKVFAFIKKARQLQAE